MMSLLRRREAWWSAWVVAALLLLTMAKPTLYGVIVPLSALMVALIPGGAPHPAGIERSGGSAGSPCGRRSVPRGGRGVRLAFVYFTVTSVVGLFLCFAGALLLGVAGPIGYTCWNSGTGPCARSDYVLTTGDRLQPWAWSLLPSNFSSLSPGSTCRLRQTGCPCS